MFCQFCGATLAEASTACGACGREQQVLAERNQPSSDQLIASLRDAAATLARLARDPVGDLSGTYSSLGPVRARNTGIALSAGFSIATTIALWFGAQRWLGGYVGFGYSTGPGGVAKLLLAMLVPPAALAAASYAIRRLLAPAAPLAVDLFVAGTAIAPLGLATLLASVLGAANLEVAILLYLFGLCYLVLMLFAGLTRIGGLREPAGAPAVPVLIVLAGWLSKVCFAALF